MRAYWSVQRLVDGLGVNHVLFDAFAPRNFDPARFQRFWNFPLQIDMQHAVLMAGPGHTNMIGQVEPALEILFGRS